MDVEYVSLHRSIRNTPSDKEMLKNTSTRGEQDGRGVGGREGRLSPWIHQKYTFRHRSACRTPAERGQEYLTRGKEYIDLCKTW